MRRSQTVAISNDVYTLTPVPNVDVDVYNVHASGKFLGVVRYHEGQWFHTRAAKGLATPANAITRMLAPTDERPEDRPHVLMAYTNANDGQPTRSYIIGVTNTEDEAHRMWSDAVRLAEKNQLVVYSKSGGWEIPKTVFSVRPANHVEALSATEIAMSRILAPGRGITHRDAAIKKWGTLNGYYGDRGGWIWHPEMNKTIGQGWDILDHNEETRFPRHARIIKIGDKHRIVVGRLLTPAQQSAKIVMAAIS